MAAALGASRPAKPDQAMDAGPPDRAQVAQHLAWLVEAATILEYLDIWGERDSNPALSSFRLRPVASRPVFLGSDIGWARMLLSCVGIPTARAHSFGCRAHLLRRLVRIVEMPVEDRPGSMLRFMAFWHEDHQGSSRDERGFLSRMTFLLTVAMRDDITLRCPSADVSAFQTVTLADFHSWNDAMDATSEPPAVVDGAVCPVQAEHDLILGSLNWAFDRGQIDIREREFGIRLLGVMLPMAREIRVSHPRLSFSLGHPPALSEFGDLLQGRPFQGCTVLLSANVRARLESFLATPNLARDYAAAGWSLNRACAAFRSTAGATVELPPAASFLPSPKFPDIRPMPRIEIVNMPPSAEALLSRHLPAAGAGSILVLQSGWPPRRWNHATHDWEAADDEATPAAEVEALMSELLSGQVPLLGSATSLRIAERPIVVSCRRMTDHLEVIFHHG